MQCLICLSDEGEVVQKGCHCRSDNGVVHLDCQIELAKHECETRNDWGRWERCGMCNQQYDGAVALSMATAGFSLVESRDRDDPVRTHALLNLACEKVNQFDDMSKAEEMLHEVLETTRRVRGPADEQMFYTTLLVARLTRRLGRIAEGLAMHKEVVEASERALGKDHRVSVAARAQLADAYHSGGQLDEAYRLQTESLKTLEQMYGKDHTEWIEAMNELVVIVRELGRMDEAMQLSTELLARRKRVQGATHAGTINTTMSLSIIHMKLEQFEEAEALARQALGLYTQVKGPEYIDTTVTRANLGLYATLAGRPEEGEALIHEALTLAESQPSFVPQLIGFFRASRGFALTELGRHGEAVALLRRTHTAQGSADALGKEHPWTLRTAAFLGAALAANGAADEGRALLEQTLATQTRLLGAETYDTRQTAKRLAYLTQG